jgi:hypothetical protein
MRVIVPVYLLCKAKHQGLVVATLDDDVVARRQLVITPMQVYQRLPPTPTRKVLPRTVLCLTENKLTQETVLLDRRREIFNGFTHIRLANVELRLPDL